MTDLKPTLPFYERIFAIGVVGFFTLLIGLNLWLSESEPVIEVGSPFFVKKMLIEVNVEGKVRKPGIYQVKKGTTVGQVLEMAGLADDAKMGRTNLDSKITRRRKIIIR